MKNILVNESIEKKRLIYQIDAEIIFSYIMMYILSLALPLGTILVLISDIQHNRHLQAPGYIIQAIVDLWMLEGIYYTNKLYQFNDQTFIGHKNEIISLLKEYYPDTEFFSESPNLIRGEKEMGWVKMRARIISVILTDDSIYVNILNTYRGENFSPFQGVYNYYRSKILVKHIYNHLTYN